MLEGYDRYAQAVLSARIECANYHPTQNCEHPRSIRLSVTGADWQHRQIATALHRLTALPQKTGDGSGETKVPLTWAMVTQCARLMGEYGYGWKPDAVLNQWIYQEFMRRHDETGWTEVGGLKFDTRQLGWTPMPHQYAGMYVGALNKRFFFCDDMRTGKTRTALLTLAELEARGEDPWPAFVVCPASVVDPWLEELEAAFPGWPAAAYRGTKRRNLSTRYKIYVMSWNTFTRDMKHSDGELPPLVKFAVPRSVVLDEAHALCLKYSTPIQTLNGGSKSISELRTGDFVRGVDHATGKSTWARVLNVGRSPLRQTVRLGSLELTPDHPVWVSDSGCVGYGAEYAERVHLRALRDIVHPEVVPVLAGTQVLHPGMQVRGGQGESGAASRSEESERSITSQLEVTQVPGVESQSVQESGREDQGSGAGDERSAWVSGADGRERGAYYPAAAVAEAARRGVHPRVLSEPGSTATGFPDALQTGSRLPAPEAGSGTGREFTPLEAPSGAGLQEGREAGVTWLDGTPVPERDGADGYLWNIETDTGNYVAAGILVHNCNVTTKQSVAAKQIARLAKFAFPMSGTPITRDVGGFWTALNVLDIRSFPDQDRYKDRYTDRYHSDYRDTIEGLNKTNLDEFYLLMKGSMRRVAKRDVNKDLPPASYSTRVVQIPPAFRAAYDEMEQDMIAHIPDTLEPLEVMSTLAQLQRLTQLASSACDVEIEMVIETRENNPMFGQEVPKYHVSMREPCWKIDELMAVMDENRDTDNPLLVFSPHTQLVNMAGKRAENEGYRVGYITGEQSAPAKRAFRKRYQAGELDLLCCNVTAGGVGLTLNRGDTVIFLERPWAYWQAHQAESRADDIINAKQVHVIDIVAANSVESRVREKLKNKARQLSELVRDPRIVTELLGGQPIKVLPPPVRWLAQSPPYEVIDGLQCK